jgi:hypothetical protein
MIKNKKTQRELLSKNIMTSKGYQHATCCVRFPRHLNIKYKQELRKRKLYSQESKLWDFGQRHRKRPKQAVVV